MIICKPKSNTLRSLLLFLLICYGLLIWLLIRRDFGTFPLIGIILILVIALPLSVRLILRFKYIEAAKGKIVVRYPFLFKTHTFKLAELQDLHEEQVKTFQDVYKELRLEFPNGKLALSKQEYTDYERLKAYVDKNKPKKK